MAVEQHEALSVHSTTPRDAHEDTKEKNDTSLPIVSPPPDGGAFAWFQVFLGHMIIFNTVCLHFPPTQSWAVVQKTFRTIKFFHLQEQD